MKLATAINFTGIATASVAVDGVSPSTSTRRPCCLHNAPGTAYPYLATQNPFRRRDRAIKRPLTNPDRCGSKNAGSVLTNPTRVAEGRLVL